MIVRRPRRISIRVMLSDFLEYSALPHSKLFSLISVVIDVFPALRVRLCSLLRTMSHLLRENCFSARRDFADFIRIAVAANVIVKIESFTG
jgi:hypothetical protein